MTIEQIQRKYLGDESLSQMSSIKLEQYGTKEAKAKAEKRFSNRFNRGETATVMKAAGRLSDTIDELLNIARNLPSNTGNRNIDSYTSQLKALLAKGQKVANVAFEAARH